MKNLFGTWKVVIRSCSELEGTNFLLCSYCGHGFFLHQLHHSINLSINLYRKNSAVQRCINSEPSRVHLNQPEHNVRCCRSVHQVSQCIGETLWCSWESCDELSVCRLEVEHTAEETCPSCLSLPTGLCDTTGKPWSQTCFLFLSKVNEWVTYILGVQASGIPDDGCFIHKKWPPFLEVKSIWVIWSALFLTIDCQNKHASGSWRTPSLWGLKALMELSINASWITQHGLEIRSFFVKLFTVSPLSLVEKSGNSQFEVRWYHHIALSFSGYRGWFLYSWCIHRLSQTLVSRGRSGRNILLSYKVFKGQQVAEMNT